MSIDNLIDLRAKQFLYSCPSSHDIVNTSTVLVQYLDEKNLNVVLSCDKCKKFDFYALTVEQFNAFKTATKLKFIKSFDLIFNEIEYYSLKTLEELV